MSSVLLIAALLTLPTWCMEQGLCNSRVSVFPSIDSRNGDRWVCYWALCGQQACCRSSSVGADAQQQMRVASCWEPMESRHRLVLASSLRYFRVYGTGCDSPVSSRKLCWFGGTCTLYATDRHLPIQLPVLMQRVAWRFVTHTFIHWASNKSVNCFAVHCSHTHTLKYLEVYVAAATFHGYQWRLNRRSLAYVAVCLNRRWLTILDDDGPAFPWPMTQYQSLHTGVTGTNCLLFKHIYWCGRAGRQEIIKQLTTCQVADHVGGRLHPVSIITPAQHMLWTFYQYDTNIDTVPVDKNIFVILILLHLPAVQCTSSRFWPFSGWLLMTKFQYFIINIIVKRNQHL